MHDRARNFVGRVKIHFPRFFVNNYTVLDCGSLDINGTCRDLFEPCRYTGVDVHQGPNVDRVGTVHMMVKPTERYGVVMSLEMLEHDPFWPKSLARMFEVLRPDGIMIITCASINRPEHGTARTTPEDNPHWTVDDEYKNYYVPLGPTDLDDKLIFARFKHWGIEVQANGDDLFFWGIKR